MGSLNSMNNYFEIKDPVAIRQLVKISRQIALSNFFIAIVFLSGKLVDLACLVSLILAFFITGVWKWFILFLLIDATAFSFFIELKKILNNLIIKFNEELKKHVPNNLINIDK